MIDISLSRRRLLAGASATTALGLFCSRSLTQAKAPMLNAPAPAFYRFKLGTIEATVVSDGSLSIGDPKNTFRGPTAGLVCSPGWARYRPSLPCNGGLPAQLTDS